MPYYNIDNGRYYTDSSCTTECDSKGNVVGEKLISAILAPIVLLIFLSYFFVPLFSIFLIYLFRDFSVYRHRVIYLSSIILASVIEILNVFFKYSGFIASLDSIKSLIIILSLFVCCYMFIQEKEYKAMDVIIDIAILLLPILDVVCKAIPYWIMNSVSDLSFAAFEINIDLLKSKISQYFLPFVAYIVMMAGAKVMKSKDINNLTMKNAVVLIILYVLVGTFFIYYGNEIRNFINKGVIHFLSVRFNLIGIMEYAIIPALIGVSAYYLCDYRSKKKSLGITLLIVAFLISALHLASRIYSSLNNLIR